ncbi:amidase [Pseudomonas gingeri]|uniref:amidase n=1 Tax=Pseudomonas gingeri TaxID=117681 RepID=UPI0015A286FF|nr:amidase [Pseudomonas gingeri]NWD04166.1 amidase [Pseudomonas gingeri]NWE34202.1 amidase [Pseudomonas gingeri]NWE56546.1 amidase [Pseudomonas gingeri]NWF01078.1 amidase [Pseudomonas gingeri]
MHKALWDLTATQLLAGYKTRLFKPSDVLSSYLERIALNDRQLNAFVNVMLESALAAADDSDRRWATGCARAFEGVPLVIKDLFQIEGFICQAGSPSRAGIIAAETATVVKRLRALGAVILGTTHTVEFAYGGWGTNQHLGTPRNPWGDDTHLTPGGSSSGSAVAVAARMAPWAIGTDTGGSIRVPAAFNGLVGLKPTYGRISTQGMIPLSRSYDSVGVLARSVADVALLFRGIQGVDKHDPTTHYLPPFVWNDELKQDPRTITLGVISPWDREGISPQVLQAYDHTLQALAERGVKFKSVIFPMRLADYGLDLDVMAAQAYAVYGDIAQAPAVKMDEAVRQRVLAGARIDRTLYLKALERACDKACAALAVFKPVDAILVPTTLSTAIPVARVDETTTASVLTRFVNQLGLCAMAVPNGLVLDSDIGLLLPVSVQVVCKPYHEAMAFSIGYLIEKVLALDIKPPCLKAVE